ncbi:enoyl-CoA hydratase/isomerase family protein [Actinophytocola sp.]|uniref:enoyl-CoA hydratase/isomerase family protein n=1 Tax=Actinophytocola sp. TaxID=1872138 RepID=UPI003D6BF107
MDEVQAYEVRRDGQVATIELTPLRETVEVGAAVDIHWALGAVLEELRWDDDIRIIVITGKRNGEFLIAPASDHYGSEAQKRRMRGIKGSWSRSQGVIRTHQALALIEKPVVARLNGDALGFGQSIMFGCDLIVAREDAMISDVHLGMGRVRRSEDGATVGPPYGLVPGDGALAWVPLSMPPQKAKEYLMLSRELSAKQMAELGIVNYAVPADQLDAKTAEIVEELLARPATVLAMTKRLLNRHMIEQSNLSLDLSYAYEKINFFELSRAGWKDKFQLKDED